MNVSNIIHEIKKKCLVVQKNKENVVEPVTVMKSSLLACAL